MMLLSIAKSNYDYIYLKIYKNDNTYEIVIFMVGCSNFYSYPKQQSFKQTEKCFQNYNSRQTSLFFNLRNYIL